MAAAVAKPAESHGDAARGGEAKPTPAAIDIPATAVAPGETSPVMAGPTQAGLTAPTASEEGNAAADVAVGADQASIVGGAAAAGEDAASGAPGETATVGASDQTPA